MKKIILGMVLVLGFSGCVVSKSEYDKLKGENLELEKQVEENDLREKEFLFNKNKECILLEDKMEKEYLIADNLKTGKIFYNKDYNSCLFELKYYDVSNIEGVMNFKINRIEVIDFFTKSIIKHKVIEN